MLKSATENLIDDLLKLFINYKNYYYYLLQLAA